MADPLALTIADGASRVIIADTTGSPILAPLVEISPAHAIITSDAEFEANAYLDLTLELKGQPPRKFFAHVVAPEAKGIRIRWMHLDPGEEQKLKGLLAAYARSAGALGAQPGHGTRRVIKPRTDTFTPFGGGDVEVQLPAKPAPPPPRPADGEHRPTRRLIKPGGGRSDAEAEPTPALGPGEESKGRPVVLAPTDKFERMRSIDDAERPQPARTDATPAGGQPIAAAGGDAFEALPEAPSSGTSGRTPVVGKDGRMDVGAAIRQKAKTVRASDLAARHDKVRVLNMGTIKALIQEAVEEAANHLTRALGEAERKRLMEEAEEGFKERLKAFELDKKSAEEKARVLQNDLNSAKMLLEEERKRSIAADQFTVSEAGLAEIDVRMAKILERAVGRGDAGPELEAKLRELIASILDSEREKMREKELAAHNDKIALLEKKVARLAHSLDSTEKERDEARQIAEAMEKHGISAAEVKNKYKIGLDGDDPNRERKLALMRELVEQNRELRKALGHKLRDPEEIAREIREEAAAKKAEAAKAKAEALAAMADDPAPAPVATATPAPVAEAARPEPEAPAEPAVDEASSEPVVPAIDPDDLPWTPTAAPAAKAEADDRGVKRMTAYKQFEPPPLERAAPPPAAAPSGEAIEVAVDQAEAVDPDDMPWTPPSDAPAASAEGSSVKRIAVVKKEPPPLGR